MATRVSRRGCCSVWALASRPRARCGDDPFLIPHVQRRKAKNPAEFPLTPPDKKKESRVVVLVSSKAGLPDLTGVDKMLNAELIKILTDLTKENEEKVRSSRCGLDSSGTRPRTGGRRVRTTSARNSMPTTSSTWKSRRWISSSRVPRAVAPGPGGGLRRGLRPVEAAPRNRPPSGTSDQLPQHGYERSGVSGPGLNLPIESFSGLRRTWRSSSRPRTIRGGSRSTEPSELGVRAWRPSLRDNCFA